MKTFERTWTLGIAFVASIIVVGGSAFATEVTITTVTQSCTKQEDCGSDGACLFSAGCPGVGKCVTGARCTADLTAHCACDGSTFRSSSTCVKKPYKNRGSCSASTPRKCATSRDCPRGQVCAGGEGCDAKWTCQASRPCTKDLRAYCGCDGQTFRGSGSCPQKKFKHRGACSSEPRACTSNRDCRTGEGCYGPAGCNAQWTCAPARMCTKDLREFCGCDGVTFRGSSTCPGKKYKKTGACP
ncbi:MAG: hypothetical protein HYY84_16540 [Deltaproteobacteria bacterium]|nr:hypothetical protein [Deltaproteobacteria bacterium]